VRSGNPVQEDHALQMVDLVQNRPGFESIEVVRGPLTVDTGSRDGEPCRSGDVPGQIRHGHATLAGNDRIFGRVDLRIKKHEGAMTGSGLAMPGDVDDKRSEAHADLRGGQSDTGRRCGHGVEQISRQRAGCVVDATNTFCRNGQNRLRKLEDGSDAHREPPDAIETDTGGQSTSGSSGWIVQRTPSRSASATMASAVESADSAGTTARITNV